jgi:hypothetical protein
MRAKYNVILLLGLIGVLSYSCSKMNDLHMEYLLQGERVYVGQPDSVRASVGIGRVEFKYWISDPKAKKMKVYWNNMQDSLSVDIPYTEVREPKVLKISGLESKVYNFKFITYNEKWMNPSIPMEVIAEVYSKDFIRKLFPRRIEYANYITTEQVYVSLYRFTEGSIKSLITYTDLDENLVEVNVPVDTGFVILDNFKDNLKISTYFLPFEGALDTLSSNPEEFTTIDITLDKSYFKRWNPPGIPYQHLSAAYSIEKIWDNTNTTFFIAGPGSGKTLPYPFDFTFDLGQEKRITRFRQWQRMTTSILYGEQQIKKFQLWGSATPDVTDNLSDWVLLGSFEVKKPANVSENVERATAGDNFMVIGAPPVRYIRYRVLELFLNKGAMTLGDIEFYSPD